MTSNEKQHGAEAQLRQQKDPAKIPVQLDSKGREVFVKGVGVHLWQSSGDKDSNWTHLLKSWRPLNFLRFALARLRGGPTVLEVCPNSWDRYEEDSALSEALGCNGFRLSLEWSRLEPRRGHLDMAAVQRYRDIFDSLLSRGMTPNVTLHHFTAPEWFNEIGGWTKPGNIALFVEYAIKAIRLFGDQVKLWATFNEPVSSSSMGWIFGAYPPGNLLDLTTSGEVLLNMLRAHTAAYKAIRNLPNGAEFKIGLTHMMLPFSSWPDLGPFSWHSRLFARWMDFWWGYDVVHNYLLTGRFSWYVPSLTHISGARCVLDVQDTRPPLDWFGVNFYSRPVISLLCGPGRQPWQVNSDLGYPIDPEGLNLVLRRAAAYRVPLYVTETGVSIASEQERCYTIDAYVKEILRALADGVDVRGMYYWTLLDNFEWNAGYSIKFGLYEWSPWPWGKDRAKRAAADTLAGYYRNLPDTLSETKAAAQKMDLTHKQNAPTPKSIRWWVMTLLLLSLGVWQRMLKSGLHLGFYGLQLLSPAAAGALTRLQERQEPPWKAVGHAPSGSSSRVRSEAAQAWQRSSIDRGAGKGLVDGTAVVDGVRDLAPIAA